MQRTNFIKTPLSRRVFFWTLAFSYACITTTVIFLSLGYRFSFVSDIFIHTGSITVKSQPRDIAVTIDGKEPSGRHFNFNFVNDSHHITGIRHGVHTVTFTADGYKPWQKDIRIRSGISSEFWNIALIKERNEVTPYSVAETSRVFFAPRDDLLIYPRDTTNGNLILPIVNIKDNLGIDVVQIPFAEFFDDRYTNIEWSPDAKNIAIPILRKTTIASLTSTKTPIEISPSVTTIDESAPVPTERPADEKTSPEKTSQEDALLETPEKDHFIVVRTDTEHTSFYLSELQPLYTKALTEYTNEHPDKDTLPVILPTEPRAEEVVTPDASPEELSETLQQEAPFVADRVRWHPKENNTFFALIDSHLTLFTFTDGSETLTARVLRSNVLAYDFADDGIYVLTRDGVLAYNKDYDVHDLTALTSFSAIADDSNNNRIIAYDKERIIHFNDITGTLSLYNNIDDVVHTVTLGDAIVAARFSDDGKKLIYHTDHDIYVYFTRAWTAQPTRKENTIYSIMHFDDTITELEWMPDYEHVIVARDGHLYLLELDQRSPQITEITAHAGADRTIVLDKDNRLLYYMQHVQDDKKQLFSIDFPEKKNGFF